MAVGGFDWDAGNRDKCRKHGVSLAAIESLFRGPVSVHPAQTRDTEERFIAIGKTAEERHMLVVFTWRKQNGSRLIRPISARYMHRREIAHYEKETSQIEKR